jgi:hypothetical protein
MLPAELGRGIGTAQILFNNLMFEFDAKTSLFSHDKILSARPRPGILSDSLT